MECYVGGTIAAEVDIDGDGELDFFDIVVVCKVRVRVRIRIRVRVRVKVRVRVRVHPWIVSSVAAFLTLKLRPASIPSDNGCTLNCNPCL